MNTAISWTSVGVSLLLSSLSLGFQLNKNRPAPRFERYRVPARTTELEHKLELAEIEMIREMTPMRNGIGFARVWRVSDDDSHIFVRVLVSDKGLPSNYEERKELLESTAEEVALSVGMQFEKNEVKLNDVTVEFKSFADLARNNDTTYAVFSNGELTFH